MTTVCVELSDLCQKKQDEIIKVIQQESTSNYKPEGSYEFWVWIEIDNHELRIVN